jgi:hypothetical protein
MRVVLVFVTDDTGIQLLFSAMCKFGQGVRRLLTAIEGTQAEHNGMLADSSVWFNPCYGD